MPRSATLPRRAPAADPLAALLAAAARRERDPALRRWLTRLLADREQARPPAPAEGVARA